MHGQLARRYWWPRMRADISHWCRECTTCASHQVGKPVHPPLTPIPVAGPFDRVGVDVLQLPKSASGNRYAVVFVDFLTKWPEVFATPDQSALTIACLLVEQVICRHGVPAELLSDRGAAFLSQLLNEVYQLMGIRKTNTTAYHPQTDGLVERFNHTLTPRQQTGMRLIGICTCPMCCTPTGRACKSPSRSHPSSPCMEGRQLRRC